MPTNEFLKIQKQGEEKDKIQTLRKNVVAV